MATTGSDNTPEPGQPHPALAERRRQVARERGRRRRLVVLGAIGAVVYRRRQHIINLFVSQTASTEHRPPKTQTMQGFNCRRWGERGLNFWAVSDIGGDELTEFVDKFEVAMKANVEG